MYGESVHGDGMDIECAVGGCRVSFVGEVAVNHGKVAASSEVRLKSTWSELLHDIKVNVQVKVLGHRKAAHYPLKVPIWSVKFLFIHMLTYACFVGHFRYPMIQPYLL